MNIKNILKTIGRYTAAALCGLLLLGWFGFLLSLILLAIWDHEMNKREMNRKLSKKEEKKEVETD